MGAITKLALGTTLTAITATQYGGVVQVQEDVDIGTAWPTTDAYIGHTTPSGAAPTIFRRIVAGSTYTFAKTLNIAQPFAPGEIIGYIKTQTGTTTFVIDELGS